MPCLNSTADNGNYSLVSETTNLLYSEARSSSIWSVFRRSLSSQSAIRLLSHVSSRVASLKDNQRTLSCSWDKSSSWPLTSTANEYSGTTKRSLDQCAVGENAVLGTEARESSRKKRAPFGMPASSFASRRAVCSAVSPSSAPPAMNCHLESSARWKTANWYPTSSRSLNGITITCSGCLAMLTVRSG